MKKNRIMLILAAAMVAVVMIPSCATGSAGKAGKDNLATTLVLITSIVCVLVLVSSGKVLKSSYIKEVDR